jgi:anthranilate phosphoribosyltransferase
MADADDCASRPTKNEPTISVVRRNAKRGRARTQVNDAVKASGAKLDDIGVASADIAAVLQRAELTNEAAGRSMIAIQMFLAAFAAGEVHDREQALRLLERSVHEQYAALPSNQGARDGACASGGLCLCWRLDCTCICAPAARCL